MEEEKRVDIHKDYVMFQLVSNLKSALNIVCTYMQETTPYGEEYQKAMKIWEELSKMIKVYEGLLQDCIMVKTQI